MLVGQFKRFSMLVTILCLFAGLHLGAFWMDLNAATKKEAKVTILYTTDLYGALRDFRCKRPGVKGTTIKPASIDFANLLYQVNRVRKDVVQKQQLPPPLLFNTGDNLATGLAARFLLEFEGLAGVDFVADVFERFGYNLIGLGNHEFSVPPGKLHDFLMQARLKGLMFSAANLDKAPATHALKKFVNRDGAKETKYFIFTRGGIKIGVFHVVPNELHKSVAKTTVKGVEFGDPSSAASELVPKLRDELGVDVVIVLSHIGGKKARALVNSTAGIDLVITNGLRLRFEDSEGNSVTRTQSLSTFDKKGRGVHLVGSAKYGRMLGRVDLVVRKGNSTAGTKSKIVSFRASSIPLEKTKYEPELRRELIKWESSYCKRWGNPIGEGRIRAKKGMTHSQFMDYILNLIRKKTKTEVAFINTGAVRKTPFPLRGYVTKDDLYRALPFTKGSTIELMQMKGSDISSLLESYWDVNHPKKRKALHFAGIENGDNGTTLNGRAIEDAGLYWVATISYVAKESSGWVSVPKKKRTLLKYTDGSSPELRRMMLHHFAHNSYRELLKEAQPPKPKVPIDPETGEPKKGAKAPPVVPFTKGDIPFNGNFVNLADRIAAKSSIEVGIGTSALVLDPINIGQFYTDSFSPTFRQLKANFSLNATFQAETRMHLWKNTLTLAYELDSNTQWESGRERLTFAETQDEVSLKTEYRFRYFETVFPGKHQWYYTSPYVEASVHTELTTSSRPDLTDQEFFTQDIAPERFHNLRVEGQLGLSFKLSDLVNVRVGATALKRFPIGYVQKSDVIKDTPKTARAVREELNVGFTADLELQSWQFASFGTTTLSYATTASYKFTGLVGDPRYNGFTNRIQWDNTVTVALSDFMSIGFGLKFLAFQGNIPINPNQEDSGLKQGPFAFQLEPNLSLRFNAATRGQTF